MIPSGDGEVDHVVRHCLGAVQLSDRLDGQPQPGPVGHWCQAVERRDATRAQQQLPLGHPAGVAELEDDGEAVALALDEREGAGVLQRVLGGHHEEGLGQRVGGAVHRDLALLHRLEEG